MKLLIISGRSGSGKSVCLHVLEDLGYYCIDNLPLSLLSALTEQIHARPDKIAVGIDARNLSTDLNHFTSIVDNLKKSGKKIETIFLDSNDQTLIQRFSETRRRHPLTSQKTPLKEALAKETHLLEPIAFAANLRIDTSQLSVQQLRELIRTRLSHQSEHTLALLFESFGYKFGVPSDVDFVFDVRCLANPYWEPNLREYTGFDKPVIQYLQQQALTQELLQDIQHFLQIWIPRFTVDMRNYLTIAIGCTGGQHRSVYMVEQLAACFRNDYSHVQVRHREIR